MPPSFPLCHSTVFRHYWNCIPLDFPRIILPLVLRFAVRLVSQRLLMPRSPRRSRSPEPRRSSHRSSHRSPSPTRYERSHASSSRRPDDRRSARHDDDYPARDRERDRDGRRDRDRDGEREREREKPRDKDRERDGEREKEQDRYREKERYSDDRRRDERDNRRRDDRERDRPNGHHESSRRDRSPPRDAPHSRSPEKRIPTSRSIPALHAASSGSPGPQTEEEKQRSKKERLEVWKKQRELDKLKDGKAKSATPEPADRKPAPSSFVPTGRGESEFIHLKRILNICGTGSFASEQAICFLARRSLSYRPAGEERVDPPETHHHRS